MIVILSMANLSALVTGLIAMQIRVCMIIVDERERETERETCDFSVARLEVTPSICLAPEDISLQLVVGMLTSIKNVCLPLLS